MRNTVQPDRLYLNLSAEEFSGKELPVDLVEYFDSSKKLFINWIDGENTKSMKKVFPILKYLNDDDIIINADDDILFPVDLIESRLNDFNRYGGKYSITSNRCRISSLNGVYVASAISLYTKKMLANWEKYVNETIIKTYNDDRTYAYLLWMNGFFNRPCSKYDVKQLLKEYDMGLDETSMKKNRTHIAGRSYDDVAMKEVVKLFGRELKDMFSFFNEEKRETYKEEIIIQEEEKKQKSVSFEDIQKQRYERILRIRKDILDGRIVKVYDENGKFVWKKEE